jgi:hypothetical protein
MQPRGACLGLEVFSDLAFRTTRPGSGTALTVHEVEDVEPIGAVIATWQPRPWNPFHAKLLQDGQRYAFWANDVGWYRIDPTIPSIGLPTSPDPLRREVRMWGVPAALTFMPLGDLSLHAAAVQIGSQAIVLAGRGRHGKTTLSAAFARAGHRVLAEDSVRCRPGPPAVVFPGPAVLRLRRDVSDRLPVPSTELALEDDDRRFLLFREEVRGNSSPVPLRAIMLLNEVEVEPRLDPVSPDRAIRDLWATAFRLPSDESRITTFGALAVLADYTEVLDLRRPYTLESLERVVELVERRMQTG